MKFVDQYYRYKDRILPYFFALILFTPPLLFSLAAKGMRIDRKGMGVLDYIILVLPQLTFFFALIFLYTLVLLLNQRKKLAARGFVLLLFTVGWIQIMVTEIIGGTYSVITGDLDFDLSLVLYSLRNIDGLYAVFLGAVPLPYLIASLIILPGYLVMLKKLLKNLILENSQATKFDCKIALGASLIMVLASVFTAGLSFSGLARIKASSMPITINAAVRSYKTYSESSSAIISQPVRSAFAETIHLEELSGGSLKQPNLVFVIQESTRYRSVFQDYRGGDSQAAGVMPFLTEVARDGVLFASAYSMVPHTSKSIESILCSVEPTQGLPIFSVSAGGGIPSKCLPKLLSEIGYNSLFISPAPTWFEDRDVFAERAGFENVILGKDMPGEGFSQVNYFGFEDKIMTNYIKSWLDRKGEDPFFLTALTITPHHDYSVPESFKGNRYSDNIVENKYLNSLRYQDDFLRELFAVFQERGLMDNTIFVLVGDHGEAFGEHGRYLHDTVIYNEGLNVPLIFYGRNVPKAQVITNPVSLIDVMPTSLGLMGYRVVGGELLGGVNAFTRDPELPVYSYCFRHKYCASIIQENWKLVHHFGYQGNELFDLSVDADEMQNLIEADPERARGMEKSLKGWLRSVAVYHQKFYHETMQNQGE